jgi:hypothetical protein
VLARGTAPRGLPEHSAPPWSITSAKAISSGCRIQHDGHRDDPTDGGSGRPFDFSPDQGKLPRRADELRGELEHVGEMRPEHRAVTSRLDHLPWACFQAIRPPERKDGKRCGVSLLRAALARIGR